MANPNPETAFGAQLASVIEGDFPLLANGPRSCLAHDLTPVVEIHALTGVLSQPEGAAKVTIDSQNAEVEKLRAEERECREALDRKNDFIKAFKLLLWKIRCSKISTELELYRPQPWFVPKSSYSVPTETFHRFKDLPAEIRVKIWRFMLPGPRLVDVRVRGDFTHCWASSLRAPVILHINAESRIEGLKTFDIMFGLPTRRNGRYYGRAIVNPKLKNEDKVRILPSALARIAIDKSKDSVVVSSSPWSSSSSTLHTIRQVFETSSPNRPYYYETHSRVFLRCFPSSTTLGLLSTYETVVRVMSRIVESTPGVAKINLVLFDKRKPLESSGRKLERYRSGFFNEIHRLYPNFPDSDPAGLSKIKIKILDQFPIEQQETIKKAIFHECQAIERQEKRYSRERLRSSRERNMASLAARRWWHPAGEAPQGHPRNRKQLLLTWYNMGPEFDSIFTPYEQEELYGQ